MSEQPQIDQQLLLDQRYQDYSSNGNGIGNGHTGEDLAQTIGLLDDPREEPFSWKSPEVLLDSHQGGDLPHEVAEMLGLQLHEASKPFKNGEINAAMKVSAAQIDGSTGVIFMTGRDPNEGLMEAITLSRMLMDNGAHRIALAAPYLPIARQDKRKKEGFYEPMGFTAMLDLLYQAGVSEIITADLHCKEENLTQVAWGLDRKPIEVPYTFPGRIINLSPAPVLAPAIAAVPGVNMDRLLCISPDKGAEQRTSEVAAMLGRDMLVMSKHREQHLDGVSRAGKLPPIPGDRTGVLIDDMTDGGSTAIEAGHELYLAGVRDLILAVTHPVCSPGQLKDGRRQPGGFERILKAHPDRPNRRVFSHIILTDSLPKTRDMRRAEARKVLTMPRLAPYMALAIRTLRDYSPSTPGREIARETARRYVQGNY